MKKSVLALILTFFIVLTLIVSASAETINGITFTTPIDLQKYKDKNMKSPWEAHTGWSDDNGVSKTDEYIEYDYAVREPASGGLFYHPEEIYVRCTYFSPVSSVSEFDDNGWKKYFMHEEISNDNAQISSQKKETYNGVEFYRIDYTINGIEEIILYAPAESGEIYSLCYRYKPSTDIAQRYKDDFFDVLKTVSLKQKSSSGSSSTSAPAPADEEKLGWGGKRTITYDDGMQIVEYRGDDAIKIYVNGARIKPDTNPLIVNDRTLVPIRAIAEKLGYSVNWFDESQTVSMQKGSDLVQLSIGSKSLYHNSTNIIIDVAPMIFESRTYLPVRAVANAMGCKVDWDGTNNAVIISK
ncbi:MAG: copper amine oxidase N-terminal domain-containing protein [Clostridia bacterium]|nr:copper amine oxidase N-terminal domain-containing protein [Clostridia bacterium]